MIFIAERTSEARWHNDWNHPKRSAPERKDGPVAPADGRPLLEACFGGLQAALGVDTIPTGQAGDCEGKMNDPETRLCDADGMVGLLEEMAERIARGRCDGAPLRLVGVRTRGVPIARRLAEQLESQLGEDVLVGAVDITLYRDDLGHSDRWPVLRGTDIPFSVDGVEIVLVDDVIFTGRTVRAALNAICDMGRPACVRLAVLIDRGHRELPVQPDVVGLYVATERAERVRVRVFPVDPADEVVRVLAW
jgi:pyrimidine operon attenuation protein/uracil phosphoribosyltransferase